MQRLYVSMVIGLTMLLFQFSAKAQTINALQTTAIKPYKVAVSYSKTSNFIFPYAVKSVDRGSPAVIAQKAKGAENVLQVKAGKQGFPETNLTVITADGQFYSFLLNYADEPSVLNISFLQDSAVKSNGMLLPDVANPASLENSAAIMKGAEKFLHIRTREQRMKLSLQSIYLDKQVMWFALEVKNKSLIDYNPEFIRFFLRDRKRAKRTAVQETEMIPLYHNPIEAISGNGIQKWVFAFKPFTISKEKELIIQVGEHNGGRSLVLPVRHRAILQTKQLKQ